MFSISALWKCINHLKPNSYGAWVHNQVSTTTLRYIIVDKSMCSARCSIRIMAANINNNPPLTISAPILQILKQRPLTHNMSLTDLEMKASILSLLSTLSILRLFFQLTLVSPWHVQQQRAFCAWVTGHNIQEYMQNVSWRKAFHKWPWS